MTGRAHFCFTILHILPFTKLRRLDQTWTIVSCSVSLRWLQMISYILDTWMQTPGYTLQPLVMNIGRFFNCWTKTLTHLQLGDFRSTKNCANLTAIQDSRIFQVPRTMRRTTNHEVALEKNLYIFLVDLFFEYIYIPWKSLPPFQRRWFLLDDVANP